MSAIPFVGAFESTYQPAFDSDVAETTGHTARVAEDVDLLVASGVAETRYPVRWHRVERTPGEFDWRETDRMLGLLRERGVRTIADLVHHTSYPAWIEGGFADPRFGAAFLRYVEAFARRYPWIDGYTLFNEPFTTFLLSGELGIWPPHLSGLEGFLALARNVLPSLTAASRLCGELIPDARHVYVEVCERSTGTPGEGAEYAEYVNDRRFFLTDLFLGRTPARERPFVTAVVAAGGADLLDVEPGRADVLGLDYYAHNQWHWHATERGTTCPPEPPPFAALIVEYWERYGLPCMVGETNIRGFPSDRATWLKYTLEQCELARAAGVPLVGYCWFPFVDSCDWDSILCRCASSVDPVGVYSLDRGLRRIPTSMSAAYALAARGAPAADLPAYELRRPVSTWLAGWLPQTAHWTWEPAPAGELGAPGEEEDYEIELKVVERGA